VSANPASDRPVDRAFDRTIDVAVVGDGPAGSALARQLTLDGADVVLFGDDRPWDATYTTWVDDLDGVSVIDTADVWLHRFESVAVNFVRPMPPEGPLGKPTVMDFADPEVRDDIDVPTFVYAFPVVDGWLVEETVLAGPAVDPDCLLPRLASRLGESVEHLLERAVRVERVRIPMGAPVPTRAGRGHATTAGMATVRFGAAAGMIHPATGYSVASSLRAVGRVADAVIERLDRPGPVDRAGDIAAVSDAVWPRSLRRTRRLHDFGLEVLVGLDAAEIRSFFQAFFELPTDRWAAYLRIDTPPTELARVMSSLFVQADWPLRRQLVTGNPRSLLAVLGL